MSSSICKIHLIDPTYDRIIINTKNKGDFSKFLKLSKFDENTIEEQDILFYNEIIEQLGSEHFSISLQNNDESEKENIFSRLVCHRNDGFIFRKKYEKEINEISSNFFKYVENDVEKLKTVGYDILNDIISNPELQLDTEDQLLNFLNSIYIESDEFIGLYENVLFTNVSSSAMKEFTSVFNYNNMNGNLWSLLSNRLSMKISNKNNILENQNRYSLENKTKLFLYNEKNNFSGIVNYLTEKTGGNIHDNRTVKVTSNSFYSDEYHPKYLLDFDQNTYFCSTDQDQDTWICFDFKKMKVELSNYSIKSCNDDPNHGHIQNWILEISNDGNEWTQIDEHSNYSGLNGRWITKTFEVSKKQFARFIRFSHNGDHFGISDGWLLIINSFEFYGRLYEP